MTVTVIPVTPLERKHCACCGKALTPSKWRNHHTVRTEEELGEFRTNRRVIQIRREWHTYTPPGIGNPEPVRKLYAIHIKFFPMKDSDWGCDGIFCTGTCRSRFAWASYHAGYRIKRKEAA